MGVAGEAAAAPRNSANWVFEFLPKAFQRNPRLDLTVITELTAEGKKRPDVSIQHPVYFLAQSAGYHRTAGAPAGEKTVPPDTMDAFVRRSLATRGYYPATATTPASLVLVYSWGVSAQLPRDGTATGDEIARNLLDRAGLVGGEKFKNEFSNLLAEASAQVDASTGSPTRHMTVDGTAVDPVLGADQLELMSPINQFRERSAKNEFLLEQVGGDIYFVMISAYDGAELAKNRRVLLWRTRMTVSSDGVSQPDSLPTLINAAAPYFGREMDEPATLTPRASPETTVKLGPMIFEGEVGDPVTEGKSGK